MTRDGHYLEISTPPEFRFSEQLAYLRLFPLDCLYQMEGDTLYKAIRVGDRPVLMTITAPGEDRIVIRLNRHAGTDGHRAAVDFVTRWLDLDTDLRPFYSMARRDELLAPLVDQYRGLHIVGIPELFEALAWAIIGQQINLTFAYNLKRRFVQTFGEKVECEGGLHWLFPLPERVAGLAVDDFIPLRFSRRKAEYLIGVAREVAGGRLSKEDLSAGPVADTRQKMLSLRGVGEWTADYVLMRCLRQPEAFPVGDVGLQNAVQARLGLPRKPNRDELERLALPWRGWEAYATFYLWRTLF